MEFFQYSKTINLLINDCLFNYQVTNVSIENFDVAQSTKPKCRNHRLPYAKPWLTPCLHLVILYK